MGSSRSGRTSVLGRGGPPRPGSVVAGPTTLPYRRVVSSATLLLVLLPPTVGAAQVGGPILTAISPSSGLVAFPGGLGVVTGAAFVDGAVVHIGDATLPATFSSSTRLTVALPASLFATAATLAVTVENPAPGGGTSNAVTFTVSNPLPTLASLTPGSATAGDPERVVTLGGAGFVASSVVTLGGAPVAASFVSATRLDATVPAALLANPGTLQVAVTNPAPGGGTVSTLVLTVNAANVVPVLDSLSPTVLGVGSPGGALTVNGSSFVPGAHVRANGAELTTTFVSSTRLVASIPSATLASITTLAIDVSNPAPGGGVSRSRPLEVGNPLPVIGSITPTTIPLGSPSFVLTVFGDGFVPGSRVLVDALPMTTTYVSRTSLRAEIIAGALVDPVGRSITVDSPAPGGGRSAGVILQVVSGPPPAPVLSAIAPSSGPAGLAGGNLALTGSAFTSASRAYADGVELATTFVSATRLTAFVPASSFTTGGLIHLTVTTPPPGGGTSAARTFTVNNPVPALVSVSPEVMDGTAPVPLVIAGSGFVPGSQASFAGSPLETTYVSATLLEALIPAALLVLEGVHPITVSNGAPGGGTSAELLVTVEVPCSAGCDDANPCTTELCTTAGCVFTPLADGAFAGSTGTTCGTGACAATGQTECLAGQVVDTCTPGQAAIEDITCDGLDDDCDGTVDQGFLTVTSTCGTGSCYGEGQESCVSGAIADTCVAPFGGRAACTSDASCAPGEACEDGRCTYTGVPWRPFAADSPWNTPIGPDPVIDPSSEVLIEAMATSSPWPWLDIAMEQYSVPVYFVDSTVTPLVPVTIGFVAGFGFHSDPRAPIPLGAAPAAGRDRHLALVDRAGGWEWDFWHAGNTGGTWTCDVCAQNDTTGSGVRPFPQRQMPNWWDAHGARACGFPLTAGLIMVDELRRGRIEHALVFGYPGIRSRYFKYPASTAQATFGSISPDFGIPCGARIQLDPELDLDALGLSGSGRVIARALQEYGAYIGDGNGSISLYADSSPDALAAWGSGLLCPSDVQNRWDLHAFRVLEIGPLIDDRN